MRNNKSLFDGISENYVDQIEQSIKFIGQDHAFFTQAKFDVFNKILRNEEFSDPKLLDVGCGVGEFDNILTRSNYNITGVDISNKSLDVARKLNPNVVYIEYDGLKLPFNDCEFDIAISICVMHHVNPDEWQNFIDEIYRVLKPGGIILIVEHNPHNPLTVKVVNSCPMDADATLLTSRNVQNLMVSGGLSDIKTHFFLFFPFRGQLFRLLDWSLRILPFGAQYVTYGKKAKLI